jgi:hypothetical protein
MGLATTAVLVVSNILVSMIRHTVSSQVRIPAAFQECRHNGHHVPALIARNRTAGKD